MRILIIANGDDPPESLFHTLRSRCDRFFAADGGGNKAIRMGLHPDLVIGDLDSFHPPDGFRGDIIQDIDQECNDLEKTLKCALSEKADRVDVIGATGKRLDQTLKNLSVLQQFHKCFKKIAFYDERLFTCILPFNFTLSLPPHHPVSLFPLSGKVGGITTEGLKYPLRNEFLENGRRDGSSNESLEGPIRITYRTGSLLFMTKLTEQLY